MLMMFNILHVACEYVCVSCICSVLVLCWCIASDDYIIAGIATFIFKINKWEFHLQKNVFIFSSLLVGSEMSLFWVYVYSFAHFFIRFFYAIIFFFLFVFLLCYLLPF